MFLASIFLIFLIVMAAAATSVNETRGESSNSLGNGSKTKIHTLSMSCSTSRQLESDVSPLSEHGPSTASNIAFNSMPTMHVNKQAENLLPPGLGGLMIAKSCPEPIDGRGPVGKCTNKDFIGFNLFDGHAQSKNFAPHWSMEAVNVALEVS